MFGIPSLNHICHKWCNQFRSLLLITHRLFVPAKVVTHLAQCSSVCVRNRTTADVLNYFIISQCADRKLYPVWGIVRYLNSGSQQKSKGIPRRVHRTIFHLTFSALWRSTSGTGAVLQVRMPWVQVLSMRGASCALQLWLSAHQSKHHLSKVTVRSIQPAGSWFSQRQYAAISDGIEVTVEGLLCSRHWTPTVSHILQNKTTMRPSFLQGAEPCGMPHSLWKLRATARYIRPCGLLIST